jgi:Domain of unknown function (DUF4129)
MTARQQVARLLPPALLVALAIAGLRATLPGPRWDGPLRAYGVAIGLALEVVLGVLFVIIVRRDLAAMRATAPRPATGARPAAGDGDDIAVPGALRFVLKWVLGLGMLAIAAVLIASLHLHWFTRPLHPYTVPQPKARRPVTPPPGAGGGGGGGFHFPLGPFLYAVLIAVLLAAVVVSIWWAARLRRAALPAAVPDDFEDSAGLRDAVESGRAALDEIDDARAAIIACYLAMERSLAERGTARGAADTPDELLARAVQSGIVRGGAARRLTTLFYEARFSSHPLGDGERRGARRALDDLAAELRAKARADAESEAGAGAGGGAGAGAGAGAGGGAGGVPGGGL